jgi:hypothetical protein
MRPNQDILSAVLSGLKVIQNQSFPLCKSEDANVKSRSTKVNKEAHKLQELIEKTSKPIPDYT